MRRLSYVLIPVIIYMAWWGSVRPLLASRAFVQDKNVAQALSYNTFINHEARKTLARQGLTTQDPEFVQFVVKEMEKNVQERPLDVKSWILLTHLYNRVQGFEDKTEMAAQKALELTPNRDDVQKLQDL